MTTPQVSLIIVSQGRPEHLLGLLESIRHQTHPNFEVVLVADHLPEAFADDVRYIAFTDANISAARNIGIENTAGSLIAFCDDDAIPDPPWLARLTAPLSDKDIGSATGFTRGRNGISRQWGAMRFDRYGNDHPFEIDETQPFQIFAASDTLPIKLLGTNMAFRKSALMSIDGFDEGFRFFLDETDVKMRLDVDDWKTAIVPNAQVHHHFAPSPRRTASRAPTDLFEIGASKARFCAKHAKGALPVVLNEFEEHQKLRLDTFALNPEVKTRILQSLAKGISNGFSRGAHDRPLVSRKVGFQKFPASSGPHTILLAGPFDNTWLQQKISELQTAGHCISVIQTFPSARYFQVSFANGYWLHRGGIYGRSVRTEPLIQLYRIAGRLRKEVDRISTQHSVDYIEFNPTGVIKLLSGNLLLRYFAEFRE